MCSLALLVGAWLVGPSLLIGLRRERVRRQPFPPSWREILRRRMPAFASLPADVQLQIKKHAQVLIAEKPFIGCAGLDVTEEMRVLVSVQAALLLLNRRAGYFANLRQVLLYPGAFVVDRVLPDVAGLAHDTRRVLSGESWQQGQVLLSWDDVTQAHRPQWARVFSHAYAQLQQRLARGEADLLGGYAGTDAAEFFAVSSELFFEQPAELAAAHPALYRELAQYYRADPLLWAQTTGPLTRD